MKKTPTMADLKHTQQKSMILDDVKESTQLCTKTPREITITDLTELLTDFELECEGSQHEIKLRRYWENTFHLIYRYHDGHQFVQRTMPLRLNDEISVRARHDKIVEFFNQTTVQ